MDFTVGGPNNTRPYVVIVSKTDTINEKGEEPREESSKHVMLMWARDEAQVHKHIEGWHRSKGKITTKNLDFQIIGANPSHHVGSKSVVINEKIVI